MENGRKGTEDLQGLLGGLKLTDEERRVVRGAWQLGPRESGRHPQAVGKQFSTKAGYADEMTQALCKI
jgi:hypothetical protein